MKELEYICRHGVVQPDIGSTNTMIDKNGLVFFVDFGGLRDQLRGQETNINHSIIAHRHVEMMFELWKNIDVEFETYNSPYAAFIDKIRSKKSLFLGEMLELLQELMKKNNHPMILKIRLSEN